MSMCCITRGRCSHILSLWHPKDYLSGLLKIQCTIFRASLFPRGLTFLCSVVIWGGRGNPAVGIPLFPYSQFPSLEDCDPKGRRSQEERQRIHSPVSCQGSAPQYAALEEHRSRCFWKESEKKVVISDFLISQKQQKTPVRFSQGRFLQYFIFLLYIRMK